MSDKPNTDEESARSQQNFQKVNDAFKEIGKNMTDEKIEQFAKEAIQYARKQILNKQPTDEK